MSKCILVAHSQVLHKIFSYEVNKEKTEYYLPLVSTQSLQTLINWITTGELSINEENILNVLESAEFLDIACVSDICQDWLIGRISAENALGFWRYSLEYLLESLQKASFSFMTEHFLDIVKEKEFLELPPKMLLQLLNSDQLISEEKFVWKSLIHWSNWS